MVLKQASRLGACPLIYNSNFRGARWYDAVRHNQVTIQYNKVAVLYSKVYEPTTVYCSGSYSTEK